MIYIYSCSLSLVFKTTALNTVIIITAAWISLNLIRLYHPLLLAGLADYILCSHRASVDSFELVAQHLLVCVKESIGEGRL